MKKIIISIEQLKGKKVLILGLGTKDGGVNTAIFAFNAGAQVRISDQLTANQLRKSIERLKDYPIEFNIGKNDIEDILWADIILKNPAIREDNYLIKKGVEEGKIIDSSEGLFIETVNKPFIGITGTKGKSFTTHLVEYILNRKHLPAVAAGNNCISPLRYLKNSETIFVLELSSWQLHDLSYHNKSPHISIWLNFFSDHQNYYNNLAEYWDDKYNITKFQTETDSFITTWDDDNLKNISTKANKFFFSTKEELKNGCFLHENNFIISFNGSYHKIASTDELSPKINFPHFYPLILAGICSSYLYDIPPDIIRDGIINFKGIPHRFEHVKTWKNIDFINDSAATTPDSVIHALNSVSKKPIVLIYGGGGHKNLDQKNIAEYLKNKIESLILFDNDTTSHKILTHITNWDYKKIYIANEMLDAVQRGINILLKNKGGTLLLSSGCSGSPYFRDLFERGELFKNAIDNIIN